MAGTAKCLRDHQREKSREELQDLGDSFYEDVIHYVGEKVKILQKDQGTLDTFSEEEKEKTRSQLSNIKRILTQLYERREKKIINMAIHKSREPATLVDESVMLKHESEMYNHFTNLLNQYRDEVLLNLLSAKPKEQIQEAQTQQESAPAQEEKPREEQALHEVQETEEHQEPQSTPKQSSESAESLESKQEESQSEQKDSSEKSQKETKRIKFTHYVPKFLGREMEVYGPFEPEDIATLPTELAKILIIKGRAEGI